MSVALGLVAVFVLTAATGYFVAQEFAYVSADRLALSQQAADGDRRAARAVKVMERLSYMLSGAQLGITVTALVVGFIARPALAELFEPLLEAASVPAGAIDGVALAIGFAVATVIQMVLGELMPKNLALARAEPLAKALAASTLVYLAIAGPVIRLFDAAANKLLRSVGIEPVEELHHGATLEELGHIIGESEEHGHLRGAYADLLERALRFSDHTTGEVMIPRAKVVTVEASATVADLDRIVETYGHTHYPVVGERVGDVTGVAGLRELAPVDPARAATTQVSEITRDVLLVPETLPLPELVARMHAAGEEVVCVVDEYGGLAGMVTLEDVAEELVGEIADENDADERRAVRLDDGSWELDAGLRIDEAAAATGLQLPDDGEYETLAGLIMDRLGRLATPGDHVLVTATPARAPGPDTRVDLEVTGLQRRVPGTVRLRVTSETGGRA